MYSGLLGKSAVKSYQECSCPGRLGELSLGVFVTFSQSEEFSCLGSVGGQSISVSVHEGRTRSQSVGVCVQ